MISKYALSKHVIEELPERSKQNDLDVDDVQEALLVTLIQSLKGARGVDYLRGLLQYEIEALGSGGVYEIQRGGGHS